MRRVPGTRSRGKLSMPATSEPCHLGRQVIQRDGPRRDAGLPRFQLLEGKPALGSIRPIKPVTQVVQTQKRSEDHLPKHQQQQAHEANPNAAGNRVDKIPEH